MGLTIPGDWPNSPCIVRHRNDFIHFCFHYLFVHIAPLYLISANKRLKCILWCIVKVSPKAKMSELFITGLKCLNLQFDDLQCEMQNRFANL